MLTIIILLSINLRTFASITTETNTASIIVKEVENDVQAYAYQIIEINYNYESDQPQDTLYTWANGIQNWIYINYPDYINIIDCSVTDTFIDEISTSEVATNFYSNLTAVLKSEENILTTISSENVDNTAEYSSDNNESSIIFSNLNMGTYLIVIENGYKVYSPLTANLVPTYDEESKEWNLNDVTIYAKSTEIDITKVIIENDEEVDASNYSTSDNIKYEITSDIPTYGNNSMSTEYIISDELETGLSLDTESINIYGIKGSSEELISEDAYTLETTNSGFTVNFEYDSISEYEKIKINYNANLVQSSLLILGEEGNANTASLTYSNNPYSETSLITIDSNEVKVYTYGIEVLKIDKESKEALPGTEFNLLDEKGDIMYFMFVDGIYYETDSTNTDATSTLITDNDGMLYIYGLDAEEYVLVETKAPDDYLIATDTVYFQIIDDNLDGIIDDDTDAIYSIEFLNSASFTLPVTGGIGTIIFTVSGILFIIAGFIILIFKRKL